MRNIREGVSLQMLLDRVKQTVNGAKARMTCMTRILSLPASHARRRDSLYAPGVVSVCQVDAFR